MIVLPGSRHRTKPPIGRGIRWDHPLAQGLTLQFPFAERSGSSVWDLVTGAAATAQASGVGWSPGPLGDLAVNFPATGNLDGLSLPAAPDLTGKSFSFACFFTNTGGGYNGYQSIACIAAQGTNTTEKFWLLIAPGGTLCNWDGSGTAQGVPVATNTPYLIVFTFTATSDTSGNKAFYLVNLTTGALTQASYSGVTLPASVAGAPLGIGINPSGAGDPFQGQIDRPTLWVGRVLTADDARALAADPFGVVQAAPVRRFFSPGATNQSRSATEAAGLAESVGLAAIASKLDGAGLSESWSLAQGLTVVDTASLIEAVATQGATTTLDAAAAVETAQVRLGVADAATVTETASPSTLFTALDAASLAEAVATQGALTTLDTAAAIEAAQVRLGVTDGAAATETASPSTLFTALDAATATEAVATQSTRAAADAALLAEGLSVPARLGGTDAATCVDAGLASTVVSASDAATSAELAGEALAAADSARQVEAVGWTAQLNAPDSAAAAEAAQVRLVAGDAALATEAAAASTLFVASDAALMAESVGSAASSGSSDSAGMDDGSIATAAALAVADGAIAPDAAGVGAATGATDGAGLGESALFTPSAFFVTGGDGAELVELAALNRNLPTRIWSQFQPLPGRPDPRWTQITDL